MSNSFIQFVTNPFAKGIAHVVLIVLLAWTSLLLTQKAGRRVLKFALREGDANAERKQRAVTLVQVFENVAKILVAVIAIFLILDVGGIDIRPLLAGAGIIGLAIGFGAQNLIRDFLSGFFILLENQYAVGNIVQIGDTTGKVERITMRITILRDMEGAAHIIPHGEIRQVTNFTYTWAQAVIDVGVAYETDLDQAMGIMRAVGEELYKDEALGQYILETPRVLGVERFEDSSIIIRMLVKTAPLERMEVARELRRRLKIKFDQEGVEIPFPHRVVMVKKRPKV